MVLLILPLFLLVIVVVLGPVLSASPSYARTRGYSLADLFWLFAVLQYPLLVYQLLRGSGYRDEGFFRVIVAGLLCLVVTYLWSRCIRQLNTLGVHLLSKRGAFVVLLIPLTVVLAIGILPTLAIVLRPWDRTDVPAQAACVAAGYLALMWGLRLVGYWVLADREAPAPPFSAPVTSPMRPDHSPHG